MPVDFKVLDEARVKRYQELKRKGYSADYPTAGAHRTTIDNTTVAADDNAQRRSSVDTVLRQRAERFDLGEIIR